MSRNCFGVETIGLSFEDDAIRRNPTLPHATPTPHFTNQIRCDATGPKCDATGRQSDAIEQQHNHDTTGPGNRYRGSTR
ncbi:uncharacterized protein N7479_005974 [Penicillium vulpinum]|uniref:uncharacterized protein n=1 Tax=Penicillium vulpinum TaxID=29845 RepID=UPI0025467B6F|nr:uncharacterized protein N7479_005974 [Penicillium vulpinum]KAJ5958824.1 hypothetical protein N7479_005974 [Penicillium vulpinum]